MQVSVIGGATDSGKTTIILRLCKYLRDRGKHPGVIIQENGQVDYDEKTLNSLGIETKEIDSVCIPCSLDTDIRSNLLSLKEESKPDIVFIEAEETVIPHKIRVDIKRMELPDVDFLPVVVIVNASDFETEEDQLTEYARKQLDGAEIICINKIDIADRSNTNKIEEMISKMNPRARIIRVSAPNEKGELKNLIT
ncbi:MAG: putative GTPase, G3E family [Methanolobus sp. T82-4]|jgi:G3E family GTPase|nr:MAG: putative GTPase, G3E family [Methanolobus sp. T82-4]